MFACCLCAGLILSPGEELDDLEDPEDVVSDEKKLQAGDVSVSLEGGDMNNSFHRQPREGGSNLKRKK